MMKRSLHKPVPALAGTASPRVLVAAGTGLVAATYGMIRFGYGLHLPVLRAEFSLSPTLGGAIAAGSFAAYCVAALIAQRVLVSSSARPVLWGAAAVAAAGSGLVALSWSAGAMATGVLVSGSAAGAASPALVSAVACTVPARWQDRAQGVVNAGTGLGVLAGGLLVLAAPQAWRAAWVIAAVAALVTAAVWTFGRDLMATSGGLPERTTALLWCLLGAAAVLGACSGDAVRRFGLRRAWVATALAAAAGTALLALAPSHALLAGLAGALFGGAYTALSGVLIAWAGALRPDAAGRGTAVLFIALTVGQALGAAVTGALVSLVGGPGAFLAAAALLVLGAAPGLRIPAVAGPRG